MSSLQTKWIDLLFFMYKKYSILSNNWICFKSQKIYTSNIFYKVMDDFVKLGWVEKKELKFGGIKKYEFKLTSKGYLIIHEIFTDFLKI